MNEEPQRITIATRSIDDEERAAAEEAATRAVARLRERRQEHTCPRCGHPVLPAHVGERREGPVEVAPARVLLDPDPVLAVDAARRAYHLEPGPGVPDAEPLNIAGREDRVVHLAHECPKPPA